MRLITLLAIFMALTIACTPKRHDAPVPRPTAYPRIQLYDTTYITPGNIPVSFQVNAQAIPELQSAHDSTRHHTAVWLDIIYPAYKATMHCTFTPVDEKSRAAVRDNRAERMALNLGDNRTERTDLTSVHGTYRTTILSTASHTLTPVQFLSEGPDWIISGALRMDHADRSDPDSIRPIIHAVTADIIHAARHLK